MRPKPHEPGARIRSAEGKARQTRCTYRATIFLRGSLRLGSLEGMCIKDKYRLPSFHVDTITRLKQKGVRTF